MATDDSTNLPHLTDEEREAVDSGYVTVPAAPELANGTIAETKPSLTDARLALFNAGAVLELLINMLEQQLEVLGKQNLADLEDNLGLREHTLVTALNSVQSDMDRAQKVLGCWEVSHG